MGARMPSRPGAGNAERSQHARDRDPIVRLEPSLETAFPFVVPGCPRIVDQEAPRDVPGVPPGEVATRRLRDASRRVLDDGRLRPGLPKAGVPCFRLSHPPLLAGDLATGLIAAGDLAAGLIAPGVIGPGLIAPGVIARPDGVVDTSNLAASGGHAETVPI